MVTQTAHTARKKKFGAPKTHFDPGKTLATVSKKKNTLTQLLKCWLFRHLLTLGQ